MEPKSDPRRKWYVLTFMVSAFLCIALIIWGSLPSKPSLAVGPSIGISSNIHESVVRGTVTAIKDGSVSIDYSDWYNRHHAESLKGAGHELISKIGPKTILRYENGDEAKLSDIKPEQYVEAVRVQNAPALQRLTLLNMSRAYQIRRLLARQDGDYSITVFFTKNQKGRFSGDASKILKYGKVENVNWMELKSGTAIDYRSLLNLDKTPALVIFDDHDAVYQTDNLDDLYQFLKQHLNKPDTSK